MYMSIVWYLHMCDHRIWNVHSIVWALHMRHHGIWNVHGVLCGSYICDITGYEMYTEYCVVPVYVRPWDMECTPSIVWYLHM